MGYKPRTDLILPEYGRNIQQMVQHAITIEDRAERTRCAKTIIDIMGSMFSYLRDVEGFKYKLWDHLAVMSNFQLDIDYPFEVATPEKLALKPGKIPLHTSRIRYMHYGRTLQSFIDKAVRMPDGEERQILIMTIANHMKKSFLTWNKEVVSDQKILDDLRELSNGAIDLNHETYKLLESKQIMLSRKKFSNNSKRESSPKRDNNRRH